MKTKQNTPIHKLQKIALIAALSMLLLVAAIVFIRTDFSFLKPDTTRPSQLQPNPFSPEDFTYRDGYMTCLASESWLGVDVSHHQGKIRWNEVADAGVRFAMIRVGYRGASDGVIRADSY